MFAFARTARRFAHGHAAAPAVDLEQVLKLRFPQVNVAKRWEQLKKNHSKVFIYSSSISFFGNQLELL